MITNNLQNTSVLPKSLLIIGLIMLLSSVTFAGQPQPITVAEAEQILADSWERINNYRYDKALEGLQVLLPQLEEETLDHTQIGAQLRFAFGTALLKDRQYQRALIQLNQVNDLAERGKYWDLFVRSCLALSDLNDAVSDPEQARRYLQAAARKIKERHLDQHLPELEIRLAYWHYHHGYPDSISLYLAPLSTAEPGATSPRIEARVQTLRGLLLDKTDYEQAQKAFEKALGIYKELGDFSNQSRHWLLIGGLYMTQGKLAASLIAYDSTQAVCYRALSSCQKVTETLARSFEHRAKIYHTKGQLDSALFYQSNFYALDRQDLQDQERSRIAEINAIYDDQKKNEKLRLQSEQLRFNQLRLYGLLLIAGLILLLSTTIIYFYHRLKISNELTVSQAGLLKDTNDQLATSLQRQLILKAEIQHRVKNNLQLILSLLRNQLRTVEDPSVRQMLNDGQKRIHAIALIHQNIYQSGDLREVNVKRYLEELTTNVQHSYEGAAPRISLDLQVKDYPLDIDTAVPLGLILNELITNTYKYAFPDGRTGKILVEFNRGTDNYLLRVSDNGVGLPSDYQERTVKGRGSRLINGLVRQLSGKINWREQPKGTSVVITF
jgi:two-component sensor histidine kinase